MALLPLRRAIVCALVVGEHERFAITVDQALELALARALAGPRSRIHIAEALRLIHELEGSLASPGAGQVLRAWLDKHPEARTIVRDSEPPSAMPANPDAGPTRRANVLCARTIAASRPAPEHVRRRPGRPRRGEIA